MSKIRDQRISDLYYIFAVLSYVLTLVISGMRPGVAGAALMVLVLAELVIRKELKPDSMADWIAVAFFAYQMLSVIWLFRGGFPLSVYINEFVSSCFPMIFYFVGKSAGERSGKWYRNYLYGMMILGVLGVALYITAPQFYCDWAYRWSYISKADAATMRVRMHSVVGSTCLSFLMVAGMMAGSYFLGEHDQSLLGGENRSQEKCHKRDVMFAAVTIGSCLLFAIMANQRSGLVAVALVLVYVNYLIFFKLDLISRRFFIYEVVFVALILAVIGVVRADYIMKFIYRIVSLPSAISQRSEQWVAAVNNMYSTWVGNGLGANGHRALGIEDAHVIADGGLVKLYCENGVVGFSLFAYLVFLALSDGFKDIKKNYVEIGIIVVGLLQSVGSNMLAFQICAPVFWFAIGRCSKRKINSKQ